MIRIIPYWINPCRLYHIIKNKRHLYIVYRGVDIRFAFSEKSPHKKYQSSRKNKWNIRKLI